jgi:hypothetical protein
MMRNSSIFRPDFIAATSQRGRLPRPDHVSAVWGLRYFGSTLGYLRRGVPFWSDREWSDSRNAAMPPLRTASRFSSSCFSALIRADNIALISSWSDQRLSKDMDSNSIFFADMIALQFRLLITGCLIAAPDINQGEYQSVPK